MRKKIITGLWLFVFLAGVTASALYARGFRFRSGSGELVSTGVLEVSSVPSGTLVLLDDELRGITPQIFRGQSLGVTRIRLEKSGYAPVTGQLEIRSDLVTHLKGVFLMPEKVRPVELGAEEEIVRDPQKRGYVRIFPDLKAVEAVDFSTGRKRIEEFPTDFQNVRFAENGNLIVPFPDGSSREEKVFSEFLPLLKRGNPTGESSSSPENAPDVSVIGNALFLAPKASGPARLLFRAPEPILGAWRMEESDDILVVTSARILFWNTSLAADRTVLVSEGIEEAVFFPGETMLIYKNNKKWFGINFSIQKPFPDLTGFLPDE